MSMRHLAFKAFLQDQQDQQDQWATDPQQFMELGEMHNACIVHARELPRIGPGVVAALRRLALSALLQDRLTPPDLTHAKLPDPISTIGASSVLQHRALDVVLVSSSEESCEVHPEFEYVRIVRAQFTAGPAAQPFTFTSTVSCDPSDGDGDDQTVAQSELFTYTNRDPPVHASGENECDDDGVEAFVVEAGWVEQLGVAAILIAATA